MKEHPTLFSGPMVRALLDGRKTQTRRIITPRNSLRDGWPWSAAGIPFDEHIWAEAFIDPGPSPAGNAGPYLKVPLHSEMTMHRIYPRISVGDVIWAKETHYASGAVVEHGMGRVRYFADDMIRDADGNFSPAVGHPPKWRPSIFMMRWMSRIVREVLKVRPERLNDISEADAIAEGIERVGGGRYWLGCPGTNPQGGPVEAYRELWNHINGPGAWAKNPWVWVYHISKENIPS